VNRKKCGMFHARTSLDKTLVTRFLGKDCVVWMYGTIVVHILYMLHL